MSADSLLERLEGVRPSGHGRWIARCPAHDDRSPSLSIREMDDGRVLVHCHAGCGAVDVVDSVGLSLSDLFPDGPIYHHAKGVLKRSERRAYCESMVEIAANDLRSGKRLRPDDVKALKDARSWLINNPEVLP
jgi:hypothetical protein